MANFTSKIVVFILIFLLIFNINSISYANENIKNNNTFTIKLDENSYDTFFIKNTFSESILVNDELNKNVNYNDLVGVSWSYFLTFPTSLITFLLCEIQILSLGILETTIVTSLDKKINYYELQVPYLVVPTYINLYLSLLISNAFIIYAFDESKNKSYPFILLGSFVGMATYTLVDFLAVVIESYAIPDVSKSVIAKNQGLLFILLMPFFMSIFASLFNNMSKEYNKNNSERKNYYKDFYEKVQIRNDGITFNLAKF